MTDTIRVIDVETTGMEPGEGAEVIELGWWDVFEGAVFRPDWQYPGAQGYGSRFHAPVRPCPPEVRAVHHIHPAEYEQSPVFSAPDLWIELRSLDIGTIAAHNAEYEQKFIELPTFQWVCTYKAALRVWPEAPHHGNQSLMYWLGLDTLMEERLRFPPHRALPDAYVTAHILSRLLEECSVDQLVAWSLEPRLLPTCPIGKEKGKPWSEVDLSFMHWMLRQPDMEADYKWNAQREVDRRRTARLAGD